MKEGVEGGSEPKSASSASSFVDPWSFWASLAAPPVPALRDLALRASAQLVEATAIADSAEPTSSAAPSRASTPHLLLASPTSGPLARLARAVRFWLHARSEPGELGSPVRDEARGALAHLLRARKLLAYPAIASLFLRRRRDLPWARIGTGALDPRELPALPRVSVAALQREATYESSVDTEESRAVSADEVFSSAFHVAVLSNPRLGGRDASEGALAAALARILHSLPDLRVIAIVGQLLADDGDVAVAVAALHRAFELVPPSITVVRAKKWRGGEGARECRIRVVWGGVRLVRRSSGSRSIGGQGGKGARGQGGKLGFDRQAQKCWCSSRVQMLASPDTAAIASAAAEDLGRGEIDSTSVSLWSGGARLLAADPAVLATNADEAGAWASRVFLCVERRTEDPEKGGSWLDVCGSELTRRGISCVSHVSSVAAARTRLGSLRGAARTALLRSPARWSARRGRRGRRARIEGGDRLGSAGARKAPPPRIPRKHPVLVCAPSARSSWSRRRRVRTRWRGE